MVALGLMLFAGLATWILWPLVGDSSDPNPKAAIPRGGFDESTSDQED